jgi:hypothetical protein
VVEVDVKVALGAQRQVDEAVARQLLQHVVEEADTGRHVIAAGAVEIDGAADLGLPRHALDARLARGRGNDGRAGLGHDRCPPNRWSRPDMPGRLGGALCSKIGVPVPVPPWRARIGQARRGCASRCLP